MTPEIYAIQGLAQLGLGAVNSFQAAQRRREAQSEYDRSLDSYRTQDTSNLAQNLQNPYEDLTVNQQQFQFQAEQQQQGLADITANLRGAAGSSGISAFAQSIANQQARNIQATAAQIGQQEARNQGFAAKGEMQIMGLELKGAEQARKLEASMRATELGMSMNQLAAANVAQRQAFGQIAGGVGNIAAAGLEAYKNYEPTLPTDTTNGSTNYNTRTNYGLPTLPPSYPGLNFEGSPLGKKYNPITGLFE